MDERMTLEQFAAEYGVPIATARYWRATGKNGPKTYRLGRRVMVRRADAAAWEQGCYDASTRDAS